MAHKLWEKNFEVNKEIERFTVGRDRELDLYLAKYDVLGSMAHITMLESIGLLEKDELTQLLAELKNIYAIAEKGEFDHRRRRGGCSFPSRIDAHPETGRYGQKRFIQDAHAMIRFW